MKTVDPRVTENMDVGTGGTGAVAPTFKDLGKVPLSCNLIGLLESFEDAKTTSKMYVSSDFRGTKSQNFSGGA